LIETKEGQTPGAAVHRFDAWSSTFWQFLRFCLVGGVNTLIDLLMLNILLWRFPTHNVQVLVVYNSVAYTSGAVSSFFLNKYWTFRRRQRPTWREVVRFAMSLCFEILYSSGLVWLAGKALQPVITNPTLWAMPQNSWQWPVVQLSRTPACASGPLPVCHEIDRKSRRPSTGQPLSRVIEQHPM